MNKYLFLTVLLFVYSVVGVNSATERKRIFFANPKEEWFEFVESRSFSNPNNVVIKAVLLGEIYVRIRYELSLNAIVTIDYIKYIDKIVSSERNRVLIFRCVDYVDITIKTS